MAGFIAPGSGFVDLVGVELEGGLQSGDRIIGLEANDVVNGGQGINGFLSGAATRWGVGKMLGGL